MATKQKKQSAGKTAQTEKPAEAAPVEKTGEEAAAQDTGVQAAGLPATAFSTETFNQMHGELSARLTEAAAGDKPDADEAPTVSHIVISAKVEGFRRAGRAWSKTPTTLSVETFTVEQTEALLNEPMLNVRFIAEGK